MPRTMPIRAEVNEVEEPEEPVELDEVEEPDESELEEVEEEEELPEIDLLISSRLDREAASRAPLHTDAVWQYLNDIREIPLLTREQEVALAKRFELGDPSALGEFTRHNLRLVVSIAKKYV